MPRTPPRRGRVSRVVDDSVVISDSDEDEDVSLVRTHIKSQVIRDSDSESVDDFKSAASSTPEGSSAHIDSEEEDLDFLNGSHRVSIVVSSESDNDEATPKINLLSSNKLKRRSIYENPVTPYTPKEKSTPLNRQLKKRIRRVLPTTDSDSESVSEHEVKQLEKSKSDISMTEDNNENEIENDETYFDEYDKQIDQEKYLKKNQRRFISDDDDDDEVNNVHLKKNGNTILSNTDCSDVEAGNIKEKNRKVSVKIPVHHQNLDESSDEIIQKVSPHHKNLSKIEGFDKKEISREHNFTSLLDESSDSSTNNKSKVKKISQNTLQKTELSEDDKIVDLTIDESNSLIKTNKIINDENVSKDDIIICSSTSASENELDKDVLEIVKKEIGVGNIDPIVAQKKEYLLLNIDSIQKQLDKLNKFAASVDIDKLPDKGEKVHQLIKDYEKQIQDFKVKLEKLDRKTISKIKDINQTPKMIPEIMTPRVKQSLVSPFFDNKRDINIKKEVDIKKEVNVEKEYIKKDRTKTEFPTKFDEFGLEDIPSVPQTNFDAGELGRRALATLNKQQSLTQERLEQLHGSLNSRPTEDQREKDPTGLKVSLMPHQQHALAWMKWRESQKPRGGILADDMGLGKTLTMISLILATLDDKNKDSDSSDSESSSDDEWYSRNKRKRYYGGTLVICPASLIKQWEGEVKNRVKKGLLSVLVYHGNNRRLDDRKLSKYNIVVTTYQIIVRESDPETGFYKLEWDRVILDEAHYIRNHKSKACLSACGLTAKRRWALTGTPIQNKEMDLYAILKFLNCSPFNDLQVWKRWVDNKNDAGKQRLITIMKTMMLRRTKQELQKKGGLESLPDKNLEIIEIELDREEQLAYQKILLFSQNLFAQFLAQRADKQHSKELYAGKFDRQSSMVTQFTKAQSLLLQHHSKKGKETIGSHVILVLLLRLRQMCCHPALVHVMLENDDAELNGIDQEEDINEDILNKLQNMSMAEEEHVDEHVANYKFDTKIATNLLTKQNPVFNDDRRSSKVRAIVKTIAGILEKDDKVVVVSQWSTYLKIIAKNLIDVEDAHYAMFTGEVKVKDRQEIIDKFNDPRNDLNILFLSLTAGGVGLNLIGANHLLLIDIHWNPQLEAQAQDRIYRFGQHKSVYIYKFLCKDTIEERIKQLQDKKLALADYVLTGTKSASSKLTIDDLKLLFS